MKRNLAPRHTTPQHQTPHDRVLRTLCTHLQFWMVCPQPRCRRGRACMGDQNACFGRWWPQVPEYHKDLLRLSIAARRSGLSPAEACRAAEAELSRWKTIEQEELPPDQTCAPPASAPVDLPPAVREASTPRIRRL